MNNGKYDKLLEKYYRGETTVEEERWLKENAPGEEENLPTANLAAEPVSMNWSFEDFKESIPVEETPVVPIKRNLGWWKYAAAVLVAASVGLLVWNNKPTDKTEIVQGTIETEKTAEPLKNDTPSMAQTPPAQVDTIAYAALNTEEKKTDIAEKISPKIKKQKPRKKQNKTIATDPEPTTTNDDFYVMVDGKRITDEAAALEIMQNSFAAMGKDVRSGVAQIKKINKLDFKLK